MGPLLSVAKDGAEHSFRDSQDVLAKQFDVTDEERRILLPSGRAQLFTNRVGWAKTHLKMAGLIENRARGIFRITPRGAEVLLKTKGKIDLRTLQAEPGYIVARSGQSEDGSNIRAEPKPSETSRTPSEMIEAAYQEVRKNTAVDLLQRIKGASPEFFERLVVELLVKMGYGGTIKDAGRAIGRSGDEGIDGIISNCSGQKAVLRIWSCVEHRTPRRPPPQRKNQHNGRKTRLAAWSAARYANATTSPQQISYLALIFSEIPPVIQANPEGSKPLAGG
jgi:restriction system protein